MKPIKFITYCLAFICLAGCSNDDDSEPNVRFYFTQSGINVLPVYVMGTQETPVMEQRFDAETFTVKLHLNPGNYYAEPYRIGSQGSFIKVGFQVQEGRTTIITHGVDYDYIVEYR